MPSSMLFVGEDALQDENTRDRLNALAFITAGE
jgi:hypothetical protein